MCVSVCVCVGGGTGGHIDKTAERASVTEVTGWWSECWQEPGHPMGGSVGDSRQHNTPRLI